MRLRRLAVLGALAFALVWLLAMPSTPGRRRVPRRAPLVALAFLLTSEEDHYLDCAALLASQVREGLVTTRPVHLVALVTPSLSARARKFLLLAGVDRVEVARFPARVELFSKDKAEWLARGCCGVREMLKMHMLLLLEYAWVLHVDLDVLFLAPHDDVLGLEDSRVALQYVDEVAPADHPNPCSSEPRNTVQGGFIAMRPSKATYEHMVREYQEAAFSSASGWNSTGVGVCWGGATVQGFLAYYDHVFLSHSVRLDDCVYDRKQIVPPGCSLEPAPVRSVHFTGAPKPWACNARTTLPKERTLQLSFHAAWHAAHSRTAKRLGLDAALVGCSQGVYRSLVAAKLLQERK